MKRQESKDSGKSAAEKMALEAAFAEVLMGQADAAPLPAPCGAPPPERRGRVFSFTGTSGALPSGTGSHGFTPQSSQGDDEDVSPAFGRTRAVHRGPPRPPGGNVSGSLEERLQHIEEFLARSHEAQMMKQQELEVAISEKCGGMMQQVLDSMVPQVVEGLLDRLAQSLDFSELRDQLIDAFSASTELIPLVEERSEAILSFVQEDRGVRNRMFQDFTRIAASIETLAANSNWQIPFLERLEELQRSLEMKRSESFRPVESLPWSAMNARGGAEEQQSLRRPPVGPAKDKSRPERTASTEGLLGFQAALQRTDRRRPETAERTRRPTSGVRNTGEPIWYSSARASPPTAAAPSAPTPPSSEGLVPTAGSGASRTPRIPAPAAASTPPSSTAESDSPMSRASPAPAATPAPAPAMNGRPDSATMRHNEWPWQPKPPAHEEVPEEVISPVMPVMPVPSPSRSKPSDFFSARHSDPADTR
ncbi:unnamed protein product [Durusdinium trenchii]|uniref:Uncharacterized protein n=1 Tax=Durusdinium trenchii TaxID=1381693 RepID=A0ABP0NAX8_9DINO